MPSVFGSYRYIDAKNIIRSNIRPNHIEEDVKKLIRALTPLNYMSISNIKNGTALLGSIVDKLQEQNHTIDLLKFFGFRRNESGQYIYQVAQNEQENRRRESGIDEFRQLIEDLGKAKNDELDGFADFLLNDEPDSDEDIPLPTSRDINQGNDATFAQIQSLKTSMKSKYDAPVSLAYIRRRLARFLYKQLYPESRHVDDDAIDISIDREIRSLKEKDTQLGRSGRDEVYLECLIRSHFNREEAFEILRNKRPNLDPPVPPPVPKLNIEVSIDHLIVPIQQQLRLLNNYRPANNTRQSSLRPDDKWENAKYLIPIILKIRSQCADDIADENTFSKMYRVLSSELLPMFGTMIAFNIEIFARMLCEKSSDAIKNLDSASMKNFLTSSNCSSLMEIFFVDCPVCFDTFPQNQMESLFLCEHVCCIECMKTFYRTAINNVQDANSINALTCFLENHPITNDTHHLFFIWLQTKIRHWFPTDQALLDRYEDRIMNATSGKLLKKCGNSKCISSFFADDDPNPTRVRCPHQPCSFLQCSQCCRKWNDEHKKLSCEKYAEWLYQNDPDDDDVKAWRLLQKNAVVCPKCKAIYDYQAGGCEHFTCRSCKTDFCRMCSSLFYSDKPDKPICPIPNCILKKSFHAHCAPNCFREIRDTQSAEFFKLLRNNNIDVMAELRQEYPNTNKKCPVEDCLKATTSEAENRLCETCFKQFLSSFVWKQHIQPWELYEDNQLTVLLNKHSIQIPVQANRQDLIKLCQQNLNQKLGTPQQLTRPTSQTASS